ncbi:hypothetical protein GCM10023150_19740 [Kangiella taiwanensis]|uniref:Lipoprotein n=1 Tax=Kangiella taiwanensis TaxID=1079179 RepID=A0ABP8I6A3_9GAMM
MLYATKILVTCVLIILISACAVNNKFYGCEDNLCQKLISQAEHGFPIYDGLNDTGEVLKLEQDLHSFFVVQSGNVFRLGKRYQNCSDELKYICSKEEQCQFVATGMRLCNLD